VTVGAVSRQEEHDDKTKSLKIVTLISLLVLSFRMALDDQCCHKKYLKYKKG
jgi:hypothetical protein